MLNGGVGNCGLLSPALLGDAACTFVFGLSRFSTIPGPSSCTYSLNRTISKSYETATMPLNIFIYLSLLTQPFVSPTTLIAVHFFHATTYPHRLSMKHAYTGQSRSRHGLPRIRGVCNGGTRARDRPPFLGPATHSRDKPVRHGRPRDWGVIARQRTADDEPLAGEGRGW